MKTLIRRFGNSRGVLIPRPMLEQAGFTGPEAELRVERHGLSLRLGSSSPRHRCARRWRSGMARLCQRR
jgi:antitoxin component of MazEF toxin-antitoxin module